MPPTTATPRRLYRQVADELRRQIDSGAYPVGTRLPTEREIATMLGISRPTVREALIALEVDGRVQIRVGSGIYVLPPPVGRMPEPQPPIAGPFEVLAARALFEGAVAEAAAGLATADDISCLDEALDGMRSASSSPQTLAADRAFHIGLADILGNDAVSKVVSDLFDQRINPYYAQLAKYFETRDSWRAAYQEHVAVRDRVAAGDGAAAAAAMRAHLRASQDRFIRNFGSDFPIGPKRERPRTTTSKTASPARHGRSQTVAGTRRKVP